jgi:hypothetical protein
MNEIVEGNEVQEEVVANAEVPTEEPEVKEEASEAEEVAEESKDETAENGHEPDKKVDLTPEAEERMKKIWREMRESKEYSTRLERSIAQQAFELEKLKKASSDNFATSKISSLENELKEAIENGEDLRAEEVRGKINDIKVDQKLQSLLQTQRKDSQNSRQQEPVFTPEQERYIMNAQSEIDSSGNFKRPWMREGHPRNEEAGRIADDILARNGNIGLYNLMDELDKVMGTNKVERPKMSQSIGASDQAIKPGRRKSTLTESQKKMAATFGVSESEFSKWLPKK